jgi:quercetin dioxygenase-like cupin family protein
MRLGTKALLALLVGAAATAALAQAPGIKRNILQRTDVVGHEPKECVFGTAELSPGATSGKHIHHGTETGYVISGEVQLVVDGEAAPRTLKAGDSFLVEARKPHEGKNVSSAPVKILSAWVVEKGKPLAEPVK